MFQALFVVENELCIFRPVPCTLYLVMVFEIVIKPKEIVFVSSYN